MIEGQRMSPFGWAMRPLKLYANFSGRAPRAEYWWFTLAVTVVGLIVGIIDAGLWPPIVGKSGPLGLIFTAATIVPSLSVCARRLHDTGSSGWLCLVKVAGYAVALGGHAVADKLRNMSNIESSLSNILIALIFIALTAFVCTAIAVFAFLVTPGAQGPNRYGPDPYGPGDLEEVFA